MTALERYLSLPPVLLVAITLTSGCKPREAAPGQDGAVSSPLETTATDSPPAAKPWYESLKDGELMRSGREITEKYSTETYEAVRKLDIDGMRTQAEALGDAVRKSDFAKAQGPADKLGEALGSGMIGEYVRLLRISAEQGTEPARAEIRKYIDDNNLEPKAKQAFEDLYVGIGKMDAEDRIDCLSLVVGIACEIKLGPGSGKAGALLGEALKMALQVKRKRPPDESMDLRGLFPK